MEYPTLDTVKRADRIRICRWYRFLPSPVNDEQVEINNAIFDRFNALGGFTPEISKKIGW